LSSTCDSGTGDNLTRLPAELGIEADKERIEKGDHPPHDAIGHAEAMVARNA
jgi:hypothetical protein